MSSNSRTIVLCSSLLGLTASLTSSALGGNASFTIITNAGGSMDITPDGTTVVGWGNSGAFRWTKADGLAWLLGGTNAVAISDDGSVILGNANDNSGIENAALWTTGGWSLLGGTGPTGCDFNQSSGYGLSADGLVAVGLGWDGCDARAFRWTAATGMVELEDSGGYASRANAVSGNGEIVGGWDPTNGGAWQASVWFPDGSQQIISDPWGEVGGINDDGTVIGGYIPSGAFLWSPGGELQELGHLTGSPLGATTCVQAITPDGGVAVGYDDGLGFRAFIWTSTEGMRNLKTVLQQAGAVIPQSPNTGAPLTLGGATGISNDGNVICGWAWGEHPLFDRVSWIATLESPTECPADANGDQVVDVQDLIAVINAWGPCPNGCDADSNGDLVIDVIDLIAVISGWGPCS